MALDRNEVLYSLSPASSRCATLVLTVCDLAKGWHSPTGSCTQEVHSSLDIHIMVMCCPDTHSVITAPPGAILRTTQGGKRVDSCHSPSTSTSAHEVGNLHTYPKSHTWKQFASLINISDLSLVRCFVPKSDEFVSDGIFSTISLLLQPPPGATGTESRCALPYPSPFCLLWTVLYWSQCAAEAERLYPALWQTPEHPSTLLLHGCQRTVLLRRCWWRQCFAALSKP